MTDTEILDWWLANSQAVVCEHNGKFAVFYPQKITAWYDTPREAISSLAGANKELI